MVGALVCWAGATRVGLCAISLGAAEGLEKCDGNQAASVG